MAELLTPDLCVIGAGAAGLAAAEAACAYGATVVLVDPGQPGGNLLNAGALPARALAAAAAQVEAMRRGAAFGLSQDEPRVNFRKVHDHLDQVVAALRPQHADARLKAIGIERLQAPAHFIDPRTLGAGEALIRARRFVIATGASPVIPNIPGLRDIPFFTTETIFDNTRKLTHLVIIGGGIRGVELAQAYNRLGSQVTLVEAGEPLAGIDPELAAVVLARLAEEGVAIRSHTSVAAIQARSMGTGVLLQGGETEDLLDASHVLVATGRRPNLEALALDKAGIRLAGDGSGRLQLAHGLRTSNRRVYAIGDAAGSAPASVQAAEDAARRVVRHALFGYGLRHDPAHLPRLVHTDPPIAEIGLSQTSARTRHGLAFKVLRVGFGDSAEARLSRDTRGLAKLVTDRSGRILGAGVVGQGGGELVSLLSLAMANRLPATRLAEFATPYPSLARLANRLGEEAARETRQSPLRRHWMNLIRLMG